MRVFQIVLTKINDQIAANIRAIGGEGERLRAAMEVPPAWVSEVLLGVSECIGERWAVLWMSEN